MKNKFLYFFIFFHSFLLANSINKWGYDQQYYHFSQKNNYDTGILVIAFNRPDYFQQVMDSLDKNPESQTLPFFFVLDGGPRATQKENIEIINKSRIKNKYIITRKLNYGCGRNILDARRFMFEWCGFDRIILFEDDLVVNPQYIRLTLNLHNWARKNYDNVGVVQSYNPCFLNKEQKKKYLDVVEETYGNFWGYCLDKQVYNDIKDLLNEYEEKYLKLPKEMGNYQLIADWMKSIINLKNNENHIKKFKSIINYQGIFQSKIDSLEKSPDKRRDGQDIEMRLALYKAGYVKIATKVNRAKYIGKVGTHHDGKNWQKFGQDKIKLNRYNADKKRKVFIPIYKIPDRLKILIVLNSSLIIKQPEKKVDDAIDDILYEIKGLIERGHEVKILTNLQLKHLLSDYANRRLAFSNYNFPSRVITDISSKHYCDIIYCLTDSISESCLYLKQLKNNLDTKIVLKVLKNDSYLDNSLNNNNFYDISIIDIVIGPSKYFLNKLIAMGYPKDRVILSYPILNRKMFVRKNRYKADPKSLNLLIAGNNFEVEKNNHIVKFFNILMKKYPGIKSYIAFDSIDVQHEKMIKSFNSKNNLKLFENSCHRKTCLLLCKTDLFIDFVETKKNMGKIPDLLLESMAHGLPIICRENLLIKEIINNQVNGLVVPSKKYKVFLSILKMLLSNRKFRKKLGRNAYNTACKICDIENFNEMLDQIFYKLMGH